MFVEENMIDVARAEREDAESITKIKILLLPIVRKLRRMWHFATRDANGRGDL